MNKKLFFFLFYLAIVRLNAQPVNENALPEETTKNNAIQSDSSRHAKLPDLNTVIVKKLLVDVDSLFNQPDASPADFQALRDRLFAFKDSHLEDASLYKRIKRYIRKLLHPARNLHVLVKGSIILGSGQSRADIDYSKSVSITVMDTETNTTFGKYVPKAKTGDYILILKPGGKYKVVVESKGYQTYSKELLPPAKKESYEITQVIKLKKDKSKK